MKKLFLNGEVFATELFRLEQDWEVPIPAFFILTHSRKVRSVSDFTDKESSEFMLILKKTRTGMKDILHIKTVYLFQNEDTLHNFHLWIFPRYKWMEQFGRKIESVRLIMEYAQEKMVNKKNIEAVKERVEIMREYLKNELL